jgi:hypothetical protein
MNESQLAKAQLIAKEVGVSLNVCFNPKELSVEKSASWEPQDKVNDEPIALFGAPSPASLSVTLIFDTYEERNRSTSAIPRTWRSSFTS